MVAILQWQEAHPTKIMYDELLEAIFKLYQHAKSIGESAANLTVIGLAFLKSMQLGYASMTGADEDYCSGFPFETILATILHDLKDEDLVRHLLHSRFTAYCCYVRARAKKIKQDEDGVVPFDRLEVLRLCLIF